jgi:DNA-binding response OmpR family regulator
MNILLIEDDPGDVYLIREMLSESAGDISIEHCGRLSAAIERIGMGGIDVALLDLGLPDSKGLGTVTSLCSANNDLPVIVLTGLTDEGTGIQAVQEGAQDYLVKGRISAGLLTKAILYARERKKIENEKKRLINELKEALAKVKLLSGLIPICASCKKIRDDQGYWTQIEAYLKQHSEADFTHGICPDCMKELYPDLYDKIRSKY